ncbi:Mut7-C RNAse domain-containing protein [Rufibacter psychrotolerans]|uniref:Mut7-C RNAse domain-containing protein n=1 Tax=Rufibacter psychrotolerans TaxID=2812556 RepID=UPI0019681BCB|nr:Mut7-C RNAse domain-containing protein [Rufibacter sp. SYSU D00308]
MQQYAHLLFHGPLTDFLPKARRQKWVRYPFQFQATLKDVVEALGVPHPEIGRLLVNGLEATFSDLVQDGSRVEVFPVVAETAGSALPPLQVPASRPIRFVLDVHLGKLARYLRLLGVDSLYETHYDDKTLADLAAREQRVVLTRNVGLLKLKQVVTGYWLRSQHLEEQLQEVMMRFGLREQVNPFTRCMACNGPIGLVAKETVLDQLPPKTKQYFEEFYQCAHCQRVYWKGSHFDKMQLFLQSLEL